jgi:hypothetical protein
MDGYDSNDGVYKRIYCDSDNDGKRDEFFWGSSVEKWG